MDNHFFRKTFCLLFSLILLASFATGLAENSWLCPSCGRENTTNFCTNCGMAKPEWVCRCGTKNVGLFCGDCGTSRDQLQMDYERAVTLYENGKPEEAAEIFVTLGYYADTPSYVVACVYEIGKKLYEEDKPEEAIAYFEQIKSFRDSTELIKKCRYRQAEMQLEAGNTEEAIKIWEQLWDYSDSAERIRAIYYNAGLSELGKGNWDNAISAFTKAGNYKDATTQILKTFYQEAEEKLAAGDVESALKLFESAGDYSDAKTRIKAVYYAQGEASLYQKDYQAAISTFFMADDYSDAKKRIKEVYYTQGIEKLAVNDLPGAMSDFRAADDFSDAKAQIESIQSMYYMQGKGMMSLGKWESAISAYELAEDYSDAAECIVEAKYLWANELAGDGNYQDALMIYKEIQDYKDVAALVLQANEKIEGQKIVIKHQSDKTEDLTWTIYNGSKKVKNYERPAAERINMPLGDDYSKLQMGILTFRNNAFRQNAATGTIEAPKSMSVLWNAAAGSVRGAKQSFYGIGYGSQPIIVKWSAEVRQKNNMFESKRDKKALKEVIVAGMDGNIYFLDLEDGQATRSSIKLGYPMQSTPSLHPSGMPYMNVGQYIRKLKVKTGKIGLRQYNLYDQKEMALIDGLDGKLHRAYNSIGSFDTSALIDRNSDTVVTVGSNGMLYLISLNSEFDWEYGIYKANPSEMTMVSRTKGEKDAITAVESSPAMYDHYVFYADMGGILRCVDTDTLTPMWAADTEDSVMASIALDQRALGELDLYTANMLENRKSGNAQIRRYNAITGKEVWCTEIDVKKEKKSQTDSGCKASPVIGNNKLDDLVFFTVTGLDQTGCALLSISAETNAALVALNKDTGDIQWAFALTDYSESSPVAVYDEEGNGWIIQCASDGTIALVDGLTGEMVTSLKISGEIAGSPAVYNNVMVLGTTGKDPFIYAISID